MKSDHQKSVSLEDLLRLKRAERPAPEFWAQFERELRAKQLAALVTKRPWWQTLPARAIAGLSRYHLPLGATAVLALTFLSVREYQSQNAGVSGVVMPGFVDQGAQNNFRANAGASVAAPATVVSFPVISASEMAVTEDSEVNASSENNFINSDTAERGTAITALSGGGTAKVAGATPSARSIAENFAAAQSDDNTFGGRPLLNPAMRGFESRVMPARTPVVDPLAQMKAPADVRRARYLGTALPVVANSKPITPRSSERLASRISDERLYESVNSRLGLGGDRLMVKF
ncbi:MAG: hypothetical protein WCG63_11995 [Opitutaceae bacterium]|jgi:hypothetical protein